MSVPRTAVSAALLLVAAATVSVVPARAQSEPPPDAGLPDEPVAGAEAVEALGDGIDAVAAAQALTGEELADRLLEDPSLEVDRTGELRHADPLPPGEPPSGAPPELDATHAPPTSDPIFDLHSRPGADHTIYLDFDGNVTTGTSWNSSSGIDPIVNPPYDTNGSPDSWSANELSAILLAWSAVAEDFAPFDVDVTLEEPPADRLRDTGGSDTRWGVRVVVTKDTWAGCGCGGFAYIGAFDDPTDEPAFVFNSSANGVAEASTHEAGHTLNLGHDGLSAGDGQSASTYYGGHGSGLTSWGPIMGAAYNRSLSQWSPGQYHPRANPSGNYGSGASTDDLQVIASLTNGNGFGYRPDDHGGITASATELGGPDLAAAGVVERSGDVDVFAFDAGAGPVDLTVSSVDAFVNLDLHVVLRDAGGATVATADPAGRATARITTAVPGGRYTLSVGGNGTGNPLANPPTGYTAYGSVGTYEVEGDVAPAVGPVAGTVTDEPTGEPLAGAWVLALDAATAELVATTTDAAGSYSLDLPAADHRIEVLDPSGEHAGEWYDDLPLSAMAGAELVAPPATGIDASLAAAGRTATVDGTVTQDGTGEPLAGIWVGAIGPLPDSGALVGGDLTDAAGRFTIPSLPGGDLRLAYIDPAAGHVVEFTGDTGDWRSAGTVVAVPGASTEADASLAPRAAPAADAPVHGTISDAAGVVDGAWVLAIGTDGRVAGAGRSGADGGYSFDLPVGTYWLEVVDPSGTHRGEWHEDHDLSEIDQADAVEVTAGGAQVDATLDAAGPTGSIAGTVSSDEGGAAGGAWVAVLDAATGGFVQGAVADASGGYVVPGLLAGSYRVVLLHPDGSFTTEFHPGASSISGSEPVTVAAGTTTTVDASLAPAG